MAKFPSFWGDIEVGSEPAPAPEDKKVIPKAGEDPPKEDPKPNPDEEDPTEDPTPPASNEDPEGGEGDPPKGTEEPEGYEFQEDDVAKAYEMLLEEGVLQEDEDDDFDITPAGLADKVGSTVRQMFQKELDSIPPVVNDFYAHVIDGKDPSSFKPTVAVKWAEFATETEDAQKQALEIFYKGQKMSDADIAEEIEELAASGKLAKKADIAVTALAAQQVEHDKVTTARETKAKADAAKVREDEIKGIQDRIDSMDEMAGFSLDDKKKKAFKDYLFKANPRTGKTLMQENMASEERRMRIAFLDFMDYNKEDLEKSIKTDLTKTRRKRLTKYTDKNVKNRSGASVTTKTDGKKGKVKFPSIFGPSSIEVED